jgi:hypothetical protein
MAAHTYWRLYIGAMQNTYAQVGTVSFLNAAQVNQSAAGTASASSELDGSFAAGNAFDDNPTSEWTSAGAASSEWIAYQHPSPVDIVFVGVKVSASFPISGLALQYSDDGVSWSAAVPLYLLPGQPELTSGSYTILGLLGLSASRRPLVVVNGQISELHDGDTLPAAVVPPVVAAEINAATSKATPDDADELGYLNSAAGFDLVKMTWANLKAVLLAYFKGQFREKLTADRTYYVRADGSDSNTGLVNSSGGAFLTVQKAVDTAASIDLSIYDVTIYVGAGTWTAATTLKTLVGAGKVIIRGINADMTSTVVHTTGDSCFSGSYSGRYRFEWLRLQTTTAGYCIIAYGGGAAVEWENIDFGSTAYSHVTCVSGARAESVGPYKISGNGYAHIAAYDNATLQLGAYTTTITGTPAFGAGFAVSARGASVVAVGQSFSGTTAGPRYLASLNGSIVTLAGETFLPGDTPGTKDSGGQYA